MADVVGRAVIEILPDFTKFRGEMQQAVQGLTQDIAKQMSAPTVTTGLERNVAKAAETCQKSLSSIGDSGVWSKLTQGSQKASDSIANDAKEAAGKTERAWKTVTDGGTWSPFAAKAKSAAEGITKEFSENARQSESALSKIANSDAWSKIKTNAKAAAEGFSNGFRESAAEAERAVKGVDDSAKGLSLGKVIGGAALFGGATAGFFALKNAMTEAVAAQQESAKIGRITEAVITATGGAAGLTADQIDQLSVKLSNQTGIDDEAIKSSSNVLLTFKNLQDTVGEGNDIFTRAQKAALDVSTVLGKDLNGSSIMLGKALNDPIKGMTALGRAGIQFTADQKEQIKTMVESGDVLGAQKMILQEVEGQVGGAAAAAADPIQKLKVTVDNLKESFGAGLMPVVGVAAETLGSLGNMLGPALESLGASLGEVLTPLLEVVGPIASTFIESFAGILTGIAPGLTALTGAFAETFSTLGPVIMESFGIIGSAIGELLPIFTPLIGIFGNLMETLLPPLVQLFTVFAEVLADVLGPVLDTLGPMIRQLAEFLGGALLQVIQTIAPYMEQFARVVGGALVSALQTIFPVLMEVGRIFMEALATVLPIILPLITELASTLVNMLAGALGQILPMIAELAVQFIQSLVPVLPSLIQGIISLANAMLPLLPTFVQLLGVVIQILPPIIDLVARFITFADEAGILTPIIGGLFGAFVAYKGIQEVAKQFDTLKTAAGGVKDTFGMVKDSFGKIAGKGDEVEGGVKALDKLKSSASGVGDVIKTAATKMGLMTSATGAQTIATGVQTGATTTATGAQTGLNAAMAANPIGLIVLAIAAVAAGFVLLYTKVQPVRDFFDGIGTFFQDTLWPILQNIASVVGGALATAWDALWPIIQKVGDILKGLYIQPIIDAFGVLTSLFTGDFSEAWEKVKGMFGNLGETFGKLGDLAGSLISGLWSGIQVVGEWLLSTGLPWLGEKFMDFVGKIPGWLGDLGGMLLGWIGDAFGWLVENLPGIVSTLATWLLNLHLWVLEKLGDLASGLLGWLGSAFAWVAEHAVDAVGVLIGWMIDLPFLLIQGLLNFAELLFGWLSSAFSFIVERGPEILATIGGWLAGIPTTILGWLGDLGGLLVGWVKGAWDWIVTNGPVILETVLAWWVGMPGMILGWLGDLGSLLLGWVQGAWDWIVTNGPIILTAVLGWVTSIPGTIISTLGDIGSKLFDWAKAGFQWVVDKGPELISGLVDFFRGIPGKLFDAITGAIGAVGGFAADVGGRIWDAVKGFMNEKLIRPLKDKEISAFGITLKPFGFLKELAEGGIIRVPTPAIVGEAGPEVVIPLTDPGRAKELVMQSGLMGLISGTPTGPMGTTTGGAGFALSPPPTAVNAGPVTSATTNAMTAVAGSALTALQPVTDWFTQAGPDAATSMTTMGEQVWLAAQPSVQFFADQMKAVFVALMAYLTQWPIDVSLILTPMGLQLWTAMQPGFVFFDAAFRQAFSALSTFVFGWIYGIQQAFAALPAYFGSIANSITTALAQPFSSFSTNTWTPFATGLNRALDQIPGTAGIDIPLLLPTAHSGGVIGGGGIPMTGGRLKPGEMLVKMESGEGVIPADVMRNMTARQFESIRSGNLVGGGAITAALPAPPIRSAPPITPTVGLTVAAAPPSGMSPMAGFLPDTILSGLKGAMDGVRGSIAGLVGSAFFMPRLLGGVVGKAIDESIKFVQQKIDDANIAEARAQLVASGATGPEINDPAFLRDFATGGGRGGLAVAAARTQLGVPYVWGGTTPNVGLDCSGLTQWAWRQAGVNIPRVSQDQQNFRPIPGGNLIPGDLVFYRRPATHVAMNIGAGMIIQAPRTGDVVKITGMGSPTSFSRPALANGAIITGPMSALLGEAGPEVVIPLTRPMRALQLAQDSGLIDVLAQAQASSTGASVAAGGVSVGTATAGDVTGGLFPGSGNTYNIYGVGMEQVIAEIRAREEASARVRMTRR